jgi:hypothetical protein
MPRAIDHLVIAVRDLDAAGLLYERLGFQVGARNRHSWGTENRLVQFSESYLELITVGEGAEIPAHGPRSFSFGAFVRDYLARREGLAMLALRSEDGRADAASFRGDGIGDFEPFFFERRGRRPDGSETEVAFTLAFASNPDAPDAGFFTCQHHFPQNFWNPAFRKHSNEAQGISAAVLAASQPEAHRGFFERFTGRTAEIPDADDLSFRLDGSHVDVVTPDDAAELYGSVEIEPGRAGFVAFAIRVPDARRMAERLGSAEIPYQQIGSRLIVPASAAFGVAIAFEPA